MKKRNLSLQITTLLALCALLVLVPARPAAAAGGNVQLRFYTDASSYQFTYIGISGKNQNNKDSLWKSWPNSKDVTINGWWWHGFVNVEFELANGSTKVRESCFFMLKTFAWTNTVSIKIKSNGDFDTASPFGEGAGPGSRCTTVSKFVF